VAIAAEWFDNSRLGPQVAVKVAAAVW